MPNQSRQVSAPLDLAHTRLIRVLERIESFADDSRLAYDRYCVQALFTLYGFTFPITVALLQMAVIAPVCYIVAKPKLEWGIARGILPLALVNVLNVVCGLMGEKHLPFCGTVPVQTCLSPAIGFAFIDDAGMLQQSHILT